MLEEVEMLVESVRRRLYRGGRSGVVAKLLNRGQAWLAGWGIGPRWLVQVEVTGRKSGRTIAFPAVVADVEGERYLVSMLGERSNWVRNVRAADGRAVMRYRHHEAIRLEEVPVPERAPILRAYLQRASGARAHFPVDAHAPLADLEQIAPDYPVFRILSPGPAPRGG